MATTTATIFIGSAHPNHSGIIPSHLIRLTENSRPALILTSLEQPSKPIIIIPTIENMIDDIYLMITVYMLKKLITSKELCTKDRKSVYELFDDEERMRYYEESKKVLEQVKIKVVFNILDESTLLTQLNRIENYPNDYEVTAPILKKEFDRWSGKIVFKKSNYEVLK